YHGHDMTPPLSTVPVVTVPVPLLETLVQNLAAVCQILEQQGMLLLSPFSTSTTKSTVQHGANVFTHSDDFTYVCVRGRSFNLTLQQAKIVKFMYEQYQRGTPELHKTRILNHIGVPSAPPSAPRLRDLFRSTDRAWGTLIIRGSRTGF